MKKLFPLLLGASMLSCVDSTYDLGRIDTDRIAIGSEASVFEIPLATVKISLQELKNDRDPIDVILRKADQWLPTRLPHEAAYVDLVRISEEAYSNELVDALIAEMQTSPEKPEKLETVLDLVVEDYKADFEASLGLAPGSDDESFRKAFRQAFAANESFRDEIRATAKGYLTEQIRIDAPTCDLGSIDLGDALDLVADNLDPEGTPEAINTLSIEGDIRCNIPVGMTLDADFSPTDIRIAGIGIEANTPGTVPSTYIYADDLTALSEAEQVMLTMPVTLQKYYPRRDLSAEEPLTFLLFMRKRGSLSLTF